MILKHFYLALDSNDFPNSGTVSDFNFQTNFITQFVEKRLQKEKFETKNFNMIMLRAKKEPKENILVEDHYKCLTVEVQFDEKRYKELYPFVNDYPLKGELIKPVEKKGDFNDFLIGIIIQGLEKARTQKAEIPYQFLLDTTLDFKVQGYKNEWIHITRTFKEYNIKASLLCKLTVNYFSLELIIEKNKQEIFRKEIFRTLSNGTFYHDEFKDIKIVEGKLIVTRKSDLEPPLFEFPLSEIIKTYSIR